jgi:hypothetical protein
LGGGYGDGCDPFNPFIVCDQDGGGGGDGGGGAPPPCNITVGAAGTAPINGQNLVGTFAWGPTTNALGGYTNVGQPGIENLLVQGWYFAEQIQGTLVSDRNPVDWLALQSISWSGTIQYTVEGQKGVLSGPVSGENPDDDPDANATLQVAGIFDWLDAPGLGLVTRDGIGTVVGAKVAYNVTSKLSLVNDPSVNCSVNWGFTVTVPYKPGGIRPITPKRPTGR